MNLIKNQFIECKCFLYNKKMEEIGVTMDDIEASLIFKIKNVECFRERMSDKNEQEVCEKTCLVTMISGDNYVVDIPYSEMKKVLISVPL